MNTTIFLQRYLRHKKILATFYHFFKSNSFTVLLYIWLYIDAKEWSCFKSFFGCWATLDSLECLLCVWWAWT